MGKTVLKSKFQEWIGLDRIQIIVHEMKCIFREISKDDYGIDGEIEIVREKENGTGFETTGGIIKVQSKSGKSYVVKDTNETFESPVSKSDLECWYNSNFPTVYIVYHPVDDVLYWKEIRSYVKNTPNIWTAPHRIIINKKTDVFDKNCFDRFSRLADISPPRVSHESRERLLSNLLLIKKIPIIYKAPTDVRQSTEIYNKIEGFVPPFVLHSKYLYSFSKLNHEECSLKTFCLSDKMELIKKQEIFNDLEIGRLFVQLYNQLIKKHLFRAKIHFQKDLGYFYFPLSEESEDQNMAIKKDWFNIRTKRESNRTVVRYYEYGKNRFWRHRAASISVVQFQNEFFIEIFPKYYFTYDGKRPYDSTEVGPLTTKIKAIEVNQNVLNDILFWSDIFSLPNSDPQTSEISIKLDFRVVSVVRRMPVYAIANFCIPYDPAIFNEDEPSIQLDLFDFYEEAEKAFDDGY